EFVSSERRQRTSGEFRKMCRKEFLHWRRLREWQDLRAQLRRVAKDLGLRSTGSKASPEMVHNSLLAGLLSHVGKKDPGSYMYRGARGTAFAIRPGSALFKSTPEWVMAAELVETSRTWATGVAPVDPSAVEAVGSHLVKHTVSDPWWDSSKGAAVCRETTTLYGLTLSTDRIVLYSRVDAEGAREMFIQNALVAGEWDTHHDFAAHNADTINAVLDIETRERRADLLVTDDHLVAWFDARIPQDASSAASFNAWWKTERLESPNLLVLSAADVIDPGAADIDDRAFPAVWTYGDVDLELDYTFDPASASDGVTIDVPVAALDRMDPSVFEGNVPGLRLELITALIRSLPKSQRKLFAPVPDTAAEVSVLLEGSSEPLTQGLAKALTVRSGTIVRPDDFDREKLPAHVVPRFRIVTEEEEVLAEGDDLAVLRDQLRSDATRRVAESSHSLERTGLTAWDFDDLPDAVLIGEGATAVRAYPAIIDDTASVSIRLLATQQESAAATWRGVRRLLTLSLPSPGRLLSADMKSAAVFDVVGSPYASLDEWADDVLSCAVDAAMVRHGGAARTKSAFDQLLSEVRSDLADTVDSVGFDAAGVMRSYRTLQSIMDRTPTDAFDDILGDVDQQVDRFFFAGCLTAVGADRVDDLRRYLDAAAYRLERVTENPDLDRERMQIVNDLEGELDSLSEVLTVTDDLVAVAWMIQELRVSLFAQQIGVSGKVSPARVEAALRALLVG
ncbi:MAG: DUF3418 domain-containing protein, partial [Acidimicrobiia bacterium]